MKFLYIFFIFFIFKQGFATTYYISPQGSDHNGTGTINNPWQTLYTATTLVKNIGDIIHVGPGIYTEKGQCFLAEGVSIEGEGITSILRSALTTEWKALLTATSKEGTDGNQHICNLKFDGQALSTFWAIYIGGRSNVSIYNCTITDFNDRGVIFEGRSEDFNMEPKIYATGNSFHNNIVANCAAYNNEFGIYGRGCLNIGGQQNMLIHDNSITQNSRPEGYNGWPIKAYNEGYLKGCKIYNNKLTKIPLGNINGVSGWDCAIELFNESGLEIYNNTIIGSIDLNRQHKGDYQYSVYIHDNILGPAKPYHILENGVILEFETENAIIQNNHFNNLGVAIYFTPRKGSIIEGITIKENYFQNIGVAKGKHQGAAVWFGQDGEDFYVLENSFIYDNKFIGNPLEKPYWGIAILGAAKANNLQIRNNTFKDFCAGYITANPSRVIDSITVADNILYGNGNGDKPFFVIGKPAFYNSRNNIKQPVAEKSPGFNLFQHLLRPFYYEIRYLGLAATIALLVLFLSNWFLRKRRYQFFILLSLNFILVGFLNLKSEFLGDLAAAVLLLFLSVYGWSNWASKKKNLHIKCANNKQLVIQCSLFILSFLLIFSCAFYFKKDFIFGNTSIVYSIVTAFLFTGLWSIATKKIEGLYWWGAMWLSAFFLFVTNNYMFAASYCFLMFIATFWIYKRWKKIIVKSRLRSGVV